MLPSLVIYNEIATTENPFVELLLDLSHLFGILLSVFAEFLKLCRLQLHSLHVGLASMPHPRFTSQTDFPSLIDDAHAALDYIKAVLLHMQTLKVS